MLDIAKKTIWIGLSDTIYHKDYDIIDIISAVLFNTHYNTGKITISMVSSS